ncbi:transcription-repair coupling factor [Megasphaera cerevisiae DSM 20462]|uniref:Transcription-repair-coupling factor n=1 Tax=Megasphaera cerevisiae DSM 20462 TaxID=1122219 RepID=A0A0J6WWH9_9FIRM|nr:transcription-repair coupling factor [Megasphaera cerevisiae]KMO87885.1 transcription-repair coupling factor [Megasphaera cerevisiae DSM 20462]OKY53678.1 transcription-repair coupling factor [Megasphaera cerevisiae]SJZ42681.1 transcription-repair coupling factor (superfamily II helicase) [Megasphaera cerevisiae DSM 20462]
MYQLFQWMNRDENIRNAIKLFEQPGCHSIYGLGGSVKSAFAAKALTETGKQAVIIVQSKEQLTAWQSDLQFIVPDLHILNFPLVDRAVFNTTAKSIERTASQMESLGYLREGHSGIVLATIEEAAQYVIAPQQMDDAAMDIAAGTEYDRIRLLQHFIDDGYERVDMTERRGHFSVRGDIIDIYAVNHQYPVRLEFFGDKIESIRYFDAGSQKSLAHMDNIRILPISLENRNASNKYTILDYVDNGVVIWDEPNRLRESLKKLLKESDEYKEWLCPWGEFTASHHPKTTMLFSLMAQSVPDMFIDTATSFAVKMMASFQKQFNLLEDELQHWRQNQNAVLVILGSRERTASFTAWLRQQDLTAQDYDDKKEWQAGHIYLADGEIRNGFEMPYAKLVILSERDIYGMQKHRLQHHTVKGQEINVFTDLKVGDYVVHEVHGIGRYAGIKTIELDGVHKDYLEVHYAGQDILYVPTDQLKLLQRYIGNEGDTPKLHKMGGTDWQKTRSKAQKSITDLAEQLVELYAKREVVKGYAFPPDTPFQKEFEDAFPYEETADQLKAVAEIKKSMEKPYPMDCLVCGDVGFGKTEVAMRSIFKAVMGGKQVAVLVPTTVLAQQHFQTFTERLSPFGIHCEVLNRFRSYKQKKEILAQALTGDIDILIGTHSLLNKKVKFKDLGMLVVDEEQRFGVAQKEKWKAWAAHIDVLTLSATPIPRTLHMSLVNLREMCVIETPPTDRFPVQTYVTEYNVRIVRDAVMREKRRGGQVFFVYNRVATIERMKDELQALMPDISIGIAHGQMAGTLLEQIMFDFYDGNYDVLLCSSLVENGLDVANANTIIIYDSDHFGLSQLYQMRGRVGRSHRMAYAYFLYRRDKVLSEVAEKRLQAIKEFTELGSGFKIAMRDLEIRGAGNLLGREQHGNIASVGFAMYCQMLEDAIAKAQNGKINEQPQPDTILEIHMDAFIDDAYISNGGQKIEMYQRMALAASEKELISLEKELLDRYGKPTEPVQTLLCATHLRLKAQAMDIAFITQKKDALEIKWQHAGQLPPLIKLEPLLRRRIRTVPGMPMMVRISLQGIPDILRFLEHLLTAFSNLRREASFD